jgi:hypothetical protein
MFIERKERHIETFNIHDPGELQDLLNLLNDPAVQILEKDKVIRILTDGDESHSEINLLVEWEECHL